ncbi:MAG: uroporphyrinogen-III synthase [Chloroflexota bacterium]
MKILITRPRAQADDFAEKLRLAGFEPIYFPVIEIRPIEDNLALDRALAKLNCYEWVVFTSVNAVDVVFDKHAAMLSGDGLEVRFAAIGPKTAEALTVRGILPDFVPEEYIAEAILPGLGDLRGKWILLPRAEIARKELPEAIFHAGGVPHEISVYKTLPTQPDPDGLAALKSGVDVITFTSASTVENFVAVVRQHKLDPLHLPNNPLFACIGPITQQAAREEGLVHLVVAKEYTTDGLIEVITNRETL